MVRTFILAALVMGCSKRDPRVAKVVERSNRLVEQLKRPADIVISTLAANKNFDRESIEACTSSDKLLEDLSDVDFSSTGFQEPSRFDVALAAAEIVKDAHAYCSDTTSEDSRRLCTRWCTVSWTYLALSLEKFRADAGKVGLDASSLFQ